MFPIRLSVRRFARGSVTMLDRRSLLVGLLATPAIVKAGSLMAMPRRPWPPLIRTGDTLICNGALVDARDYPDLFAALGNEFGGSGNFFRLPDFDMNISDYTFGYVMKATGSDASFPVGMINLIYRGFINA